MALRLEIPKSRVEPGRHPVLTLALLVVAITAVSSSAVLVRWADASPVALAFWRTAGGAIILVAPSLRSGHRPARSQWPLLIVAGVALGVHFATWLASLELTSVAASVTLVSTAPLIIAVYLLATGRAPTRPTWIAIGLALAGVAVITAGDIGAGGDELAGDGLALLGAMAVAVYLLAGHQLRATMATSTYASRAYGVAALSLVPVIVVFDISLLGYDKSTWLAIGAMIVGPQLAGHTMLNLLLKQLGSVSVSLALLIEPLGASLLVWLLLGELPPVAAVLGAPLVLSGVVLHVIEDRAPG